MSTIDPKLSVNVKDSEPVIKTLKSERSSLQNSQDNGSDLRKLGIPLAVGSGMVAAWAVSDPQLTETSIWTGSMYAALSTALGAGSGISMRNHSSRGDRLDSINQDISNTYLFGEDADFSELISSSEKVDFRDFYFETENGQNQNLYDFHESDAIGFYESLMLEPEVEQFLTVNEVEEGNKYVLGVGIDNDLAGRFVGYTEEDIEYLLEEGEPGEEFRRYW